MVGTFQALMVIMAKLSSLSAESMIAIAEPTRIREKASEIREELFAWWNNCPAGLKQQDLKWRSRLPKPSTAERLEAEAFSSTKACMCACMIYLSHIVDPSGKSSEQPLVSSAINGIFDIARETPAGTGLEMGLSWALFTAGAALFVDIEAEKFVRQKLTTDARVSLYVSLAHNFWEYKFAPMLNRDAAC